MEFSREEYWSGLPFPSPGALPDPGIEQHLLCLLHWQADSLLLAPPGKPVFKDKFDFPGGSVVKNLPAMQETYVQSLGGEDPRRRKWQLIPVFFPVKSHGQRSLPDYSQWGSQKSQKQLRD